MPREKYIECRDCKEEFDAENPLHKGHGYYDQCRDCSEIKGTNKDIKVKARTEFNNDGDWQGIQILTAEQFAKEKEIEEYYGGGVVAGADVGESGE